MKFTGKNGAAVRDWVNERAPESTTWFVTRGMAASTGQAWPYLRALGGWGEGVKAAIYDEPSGQWLPVRVGDYVERTAAGGMEVRTVSPEVAQ